MNKGLFLSCLLLVLVCCSQQALALIEGDVEFTAAGDGTAWVGERVVLNLDLWSNGFSFSGQAFELPEVDGGFLVRPDSSTVILSEQRNGETWQGIRYTILFYAQRAGELRVPSFEVRFSAQAGFGTEPGNFRLQTESLLISTNLPPGADPGQLLVTTRNFDLDYQWSRALGEGEVLELKTGDALELEVNRRADEVPGMMFSDLPLPNIDGLAIYAAKPEVEDRMNRGSLTGSRKDRITLLCEREGSYSLPALAFQSFDPGSGVLEVQEIPGFELSVVAGPMATVPASANNGGIPVVNWLAWILALALLGLGLRYGLPRLRHGLEVRRQVKRQGEAWAFAQVQSACRAGDPAAAWRAINEWMGRMSLEPGMSLSAIARQSGSQKFQDEALLIQQALLVPNNRNWRGETLFKELETWRKKKRARSSAVEALPALNPQS